jgi:hypothetical protein
MSHPGYISWAQSRGTKLGYYRASVSCGKNPASIPDMSTSNKTDAGQTIVESESAAVDQDLLVMEVVAETAFVWAANASL